MKVLAVSGGTLNGSNDAFAKEALMGAREAGAEIEFVRLLDMELKPCTGCVACVNSLMTGGPGNCVIKDDFNWFDEKILNADAVIFVNPVFEKGVPAVFRMVQDRMCGPSHDTGTNMVAKHIAEEMGKPGPDPRKFKKKVVSFIAIGGSDWNVRASCDMNLAAMSPMWTVIDDEVFSWGKSIILDDAAVAVAHQIGKNIAEAAKNPETAKYNGKPGICSCCNSRNFYIHADGRAECEVCGIIGHLVPDGDGVKFEYPPEMMERAHTQMPGKMHHMDDIYKNESKLNEQKKTPEYRERVDKYKEFIQATKPGA